MLIHYFNYVYILFKNCLNNLREKYTWLEQLLEILSIRLQSVVDYRYVKIQCEKIESVLNNENPQAPRSRHVIVKCLQKLDELKRQTAFIEAYRHFCTKAPRACKCLIEYKCGEEMIHKDEELVLLEDVTPNASHNKEWNGLCELLVTNNRLGQRSFLIPTICLWFFNGGVEQDAFARKIDEYDKMQRLLLFSYNHTMSVILDSGYYLRLERRCCLLMKRHSAVNRGKSESSKRVDLNCREEQTIQLNLSCRSSMSFYCSSSEHMHTGGEERSSNKDNDGMTRTSFWSSDITEKMTMTAQTTTLNGMWLDNGFLCQNI